MKAPICILALLLLALLVPVRADEALKQSLVFHASFDETYDADFSKGDPVAYVKSGEALVPVPDENEEALIVDEGGKYEGALWFPKKGTTRPTFRGEGMFGYNEKSWSATVSLWLSITPDEDLEPGYCDPIQIIGDDTKKGFIFLEWSKDHTPRYFRYAIRPRIELWDPEGLGWEVLPEEKRPMVQLKTAPFTRDGWTHAVFTLDRINEGIANASGTLYLDGKKQGTIQNHDLTFGWDAKAVALVLGASYIGYLDDLSVFDRVLSDEEVTTLHALETGAAELRP